MKSRYKTIVLVILCICLFYIMKNFMKSTFRYDRNELEKKYIKLPGNLQGQCNKLFDKDFDHVFTPYQKILKQEFDSFIKRIKKWMEGNSGQIEAQTMFYYKLVRENNLVHICETGFNAGHSAFTFLLATNSTKYYGFDIGQHTYGKQSAEWMDKKFPGRFKITWGDSQQTFNKTLFPALLCDAVIVDGGHTFMIAKQDLLNGYYFANPAGHVLVVDDFPGYHTHTVGAAWNFVKKLGMINETFSCKHDKYRGFTVGVYNTQPNT